MSELVEIKIPDLGGVDEVEVVEVLVQSGDAVEQEQTLAVMESDKATIDLPTSVAGTIQEVVIKVGDKVSQDSLVAMILPSVSGDSNEPIAEGKQAETPIEKPTVEQKVEKQTKPVKEKPAPAAKQPTTEPTLNSSKVHATPSVRLFARELGADLSQIDQGSGRKGRILREDVQSFVEKVMSGEAQQGGTAIAPIPEVDFSQFGETEVQALGKIKRLTGERMVRICLNLPMVTQHDEADITEMEDFRKATNSGAPEIKLTGLVFIIKALVSALNQFPQFNSSLSTDGQSLILKKYCNIGIAVETPNGLVVPVIRDADTMSLNQLSAELVELSGQARE